MYTFQTTANVDQGYLLPQTVFRIFQDNTIQETLDEFGNPVKISGRAFNNLRFAVETELLDELENNSKS